jgi:phosphopentomutase
MFRRITVIVLDSVGIGEAPDAHSFGDSGAHTLGHICEQNPMLNIPNMKNLGLANIASLSGISEVATPTACYGKMMETSIGKDTMTGHWELMGLNVTLPFQTYPNGFPPALIEAFEQRTGRKVIGNKPASGTEILDELGEIQMQSGDWIVYTSADSVFQIAAHEKVIPLDELYRACEIARELTLQPAFGVGRVIARPYVGDVGHFRRTSNRHDYAIAPPERTVLDDLKEAGKDVIAVGKIHDIFCGEGITKSTHTVSNLDGIQQTIALLQTDFEGLLFTNLVDFDSLYGHRRDPIGYGQALEQFDQWLPEILKHIKEDDLLIITADHGNDPTHTGTDHTREFVPILAYNPKIDVGQPVGIRNTFADVGATILDNFGRTNFTHGTSLLNEIQNAIN